MAAAARARTGRIALTKNLRERILAGTLEPGTDLAQAALAEELGVSRTPLREALRVLEGEGFVEMRPNGRVTVTPISVAGLDQLYGMRITLEAFACMQSVPALTPGDLDDLRRELEAMAACVADGDENGLEEPHQRFHRRIVRHAGDQVVSTLGILADRARRYRYAYIASEPRAFGFMEAEHRGIFDACCERDGTLAAERLARHLAHTVLTVMAHVDPQREAVAVRAALRLTLSGCAGTGDGEGRR